MTEIAVALIGMGKMGRALQSLAPERGFRVVATLDPSHADYRGVTKEALAEEAAQLQHADRRKRGVAADLQGEALVQARRQAADEFERC